MPFIYDPAYFAIAGVGALLAIGAQVMVKSAYAAASRVGVASGMTGAQAAQAILDHHGVSGVGIEMVQGTLSDHYDPKARVLRLSPDVYSGRSAASVGIAAHEVGHALQHAHGYAPLKIRSGIVPLAAVGGFLSEALLVLGVILNVGNLILIGALLFAGVVFFQLVNLPVEFNASSRARRELLTAGIISSEEDRMVGRVLNAAALTYVAATISAILTLVYFLLKAQSRR